MNLRVNDIVVVLSGKDRGKKGKVLQVFRRDDRLGVEGINTMGKNVRPRRSREKGQLVKFNAPLHASNVQLVCPKCGKPTRIRHLITGDKKQRQCAKCQQIID